MPDLASFNGLPYLQVFVGGLVTLLAIWLMIQAQRDKAKVPAPADLPQGLQMFFNGPLIQALQCLKEQGAELHRMNGSMRDLVHGQANALMVLNSISENDRRVREELAQQTQRHAELMNDLQNKAEDILQELRRRRV